MRDLNDIKTRVIAMIVLVAPVTFVEFVVDAGSGLEALELRGGVALVVGALTVFTRSAMGTKATTDRIVRCGGSGRQLAEVEALNGLGCY
jgi:uncharacterized membrane protein YqhA